MKDKTYLTVAVNIFILALLTFSIISIVKINSLNDENKLLTEALDASQTQSLEWQDKAQTTQTKLNRANADLVDCSERMEELEELIYVLKCDYDALLTENEYLTEISEYVYNGDWNYYYDESDVEMLAGVMYGENWVSGRYEMMLTGSVVLNRVLDERFPNNIHDVIYQKDGQYEQYAPRTKRLIGSDEVPEICYDLARILLECGPIAPREVVYQAHFNQGKVFYEYKGEEFCYG